MNTTHSRRALPAAICAALTVLAAPRPAAPAATAADGPVAARGPVDAPIVNIEGDAVRGVAVASGYAFRGLPYAAAPTGDLRWRPRSSGEVEGRPRRHPIRAELPAAGRPVANPFVPPGRLDEDCLYLNVSTPTLRGHGAGSAGARLDPRGRTSRKTPPATTTAPSSPPRERSSSLSITGSGRSASLRILRSPLGRAVRPATTA